MNLGAKLPKVILAKRRMPDARGWPLRFSRLELAERCGASHALAESKYWIESRRALMGAAFHAVAEAGGDWTVPECEALTNEEITELRTYSLPQDHESIPPMDSDLWRHEHSIGIREDLSTVAWDDDGTLAARGTMDMVHIPHDGSIVYVCDIKLSTYISDPMTLQLSLPALALAKALAAEAFVCGLWIASEARWIFSSRVFLGSSAAMNVEQRFRRALATDPAVYTTGLHCDSHCFSRHQCPAWMTEATDATDLELLASGDFANGDVASFYRRIKALEEIVDMGKKSIRAYLENAPPVDMGDGQELAMCQRAGRESLSVAKLRETYPDVAAELVTRGPTSRFPRLRKRK